MDKIGIIGTGMLGGAIAKRLLDLDYNVVVYNRTRSKAQKLVKYGAKVKDSPKLVAKESELIITVVRDADAVNEICFGKDGIIDGISQGTIIADMSTIDPTESRKIAKKFIRKKIQMLDIPVMGGPDVASQGGLIMMAAGNRSTYNKCSRIFDSLASERFFLGKNGTAHAVKLSMNLQISMLALAISEDITLARGASVDPKTFLDILNSTYFKTGMSKNKAYKMIKNEFVPTFTLENLTKDLNTITTAAKTFGITLPITTQVEKIYEKAKKEGFGKLDYTGILSYIKKIQKQS